MTTTQHTSPIDMTDAQLQEAWETVGGFSDDQWDSLTTAQQKYLNRRAEALAVEMDARNLEDNL